MIKRILHRFVPKVQVVQIPAAADVDSIVVGLNRTLSRLRDASLAHSTVAEKHRELARQSEQAAIVADAEAVRAIRVAVKIAAIVS